MTERLTIGSIGHRGDGVAAMAGGHVFVPFTLPGEEVTVDPVPGHPDRRVLVRVETPSPQRVEPVCPHFGVCGGCALQHWAADRYSAWKRSLVADALAHVELAPPIDELVDAHGEGRRRVVLHARRSAGDVLQVGFAAPRAHHIVPIDRCPVLAPGLARAIEVAWKLAEALRPVRKPLDIQLTATEAGLDVDVRGSGPLPPAREAALVRLATDLRLARLTRHGALVAQAGVPTVRMGRAAAQLPPGAFLQATARGEETLVRLVAGHVGAAATVADLFCGVGPFALRLAERATVTALDSDAEAIAALRRTAAATPGLRPMQIAARDLFRAPMLAKELAAFRAVVFDPPRQGAVAQAQEIAASKAPLVVGVSCNPGTFARDARILADGGYRLERVTPVDQFRYSAHVELVGVFRR
ncbi:MAG: class I SAM-dependent RNA methyltransferase [Variibacter sp.]|nr:class I SAM-dependent RNA methyltransferase [Variibacter sp.]